MHASNSKHFNNILLSLSSFYLSSYLGITQCLINSVTRSFAIIVLSYILYTLSSIHSHVIWIHYFFFISSRTKRRKKPAYRYFYVCIHSSIHTSNVFRFLSCPPSDGLHLFKISLYISLTIILIDWHKMPRECRRRTIFYSFLNHIN